MTSLNVTLHQLVLGERHAKTGHYLRTYVDSVVKMVILPRSAARLLTGVGDFARVDAVGFTDVAVVDGDQVTDSNGRTYTVLTSQPCRIGNVTVYYECGLAGFAPNMDADYVEQYFLFILATDHGSTSPAEGMYLHSYGDEVTVTATADSGCIFTEFQQDNGVESTDNPYTFTVSRSMAVMAVFSAVTIPPYPSGIGLYVGSDSFGNPEIVAELAFPSPLNNNAEIESALAFPTPLGFTASISAALDIQVS
jgi:hypothetical protein